MRRRAAAELGDNLRCSSSNDLNPRGVMIGESGCALPAEQHGYSDMHFDGEPAAVNVSIERDGEVKSSQEFTPEYKSVYPNGESCGPACTQASGTLGSGRSLAAFSAWPHGAQKAIGRWPADEPG